MRVFWWDEFQPTTLRWLDGVPSMGAASYEYDAQYGQYSVTNLIGRGFQEISVQTAKALALC